MKAGRDQVGVWEEKVFDCQKFDNVVFQLENCASSLEKKWISLLKKKEISPAGEIRFFTTEVVRVVLADRAC